MAKSVEEPVEDWAKESLDDYDVRCFDKCLLAKSEKGTIEENAA